MRPCHTVDRKELSECCLEGRIWKANAGQEASQSPCLPASRERVKILLENCLRTLLRLVERFKLSFEARIRMGTASENQSLEFTCSTITTVSPSILAKLMKVLVRV